MTRRDPDRPAPIWLSDHWERKKTETAHRVRTAIELLIAEHHAVTISAIRNKVTTVFGVPFSANTIKRNEAAYTLYLSSRQPPRNRSARDVLLRDLYVHASDTEKSQLRAKVARLRRQSKDNLIARLIALEHAVTVQTEVENRLREEIIRNSLQAGASHQRAKEVTSSPGVVVEGERT